MTKFSPYFAFARKSFLGRSAYRFDHFMGILNTILRIFIFWEIYQALYGGRAEVDGITITMVATYIDQPKREHLRRKTDRP